MSIAALDPRLRPPPARPHLRVIRGGRSPLPAEVYRRRRLVAGVATAVAVAVLVLGVATGFGFLLGAVEGGPAPTGPAGPEPEAPGGRAQPAAAAPAGAATVTVQPGDTLWSVARRVQPEGDVRATVDRLAEANGGAQLEVGQVLVLP